MDDKWKQMTEKLGRDGDAVRRLMQSRDGQTLMQALTRPDNGAGLQRALTEAMRGDTEAMRALIERLMQDPDGKALVERISREASK